MGVGHVSAFRIRPAAAADRAAVLVLLRDADLTEEGVEEQFNSGFVVAEIEGRIVAAAGLETYDVYGLLRSVVVSPDLRGRGVGEALVRDRLAWAAGHGLQQVYLLTTTAAPFFSRLGFSSISREAVPEAAQRSPEFAGICPSTATVMVLNTVA